MCSLHHVHVCVINIPLICNFLVCIILFVGNPLAIITSNNDIQPIISQVQSFRINYLVNSFPYKSILSQYAYISGLENSSKSHHT